jgi:hypothetical protein
VNEPALRRAERDAILEAAPFAALACVALAVLAAVSAHAGWEFDGVRWRMWATTAGVWAVLSVVLLLGLGSVTPHRHDDRRRIVEVLLGIVVAFSVGQTILLVGSLVSGPEPTGAQLLQSGATLWLSNVIAFGLAFWELDNGGPVARALAAERRTPDFGFPQDLDAEVARPGWAPRLMDYLYVALTNSIAFSPTDTMPLTRRAKGAMALEAAISVVALLIVAARAINILG